MTEGRADWQVWSRRLQPNSLDQPDGRGFDPAGPLTVGSPAAYTAAGRSIEVIGGQSPACGVAMTLKPCLS